MNYVAERELIRLRRQNELLFKIVQMYRTQVHSLQRTINSANAEYESFLTEIRAKESPD